MNCPNCGSPYEQNDTFCPQCNTPLGNAHYTPVEHRGKGVIRFFLILLLLTAISISTLFGYRYYMAYAQDTCTANASEFMEAVQGGTFSKISQLLPENLQNYNTPDPWIKDTVNQKIQDLALEERLSYYNVSVDLDALQKMILENASYHIGKIDVNKNLCDVTVSVENYNYADLLASIQEELPEIPASHEEEEEHTWWGGFSDWLHDWTSQEKPGENYPDSINDWIIQLKENSTPVTREGQLHYQWIRGSWTLISVDSTLINSLYGFPDLQE